MYKTASIPYNMFCNMICFKLSAGKALNYYKFIFQTPFADIILSLRLYHIISTNAFIILWYSLLKCTVSVAGVCMTPLYPSENRCTNDIFRHNLEAQINFRKALPVSRCVFTDKKFKAVLPKIFVQ